MRETTAILGAGAWGTALAVMLSRSGHHVALCARRRDLADRIATSRQNSEYLPEVAIPSEVEINAAWNDAIANASTIVLAVPSRFARSAMAPVANAIRSTSIIVSATKGIEEDSLATMTAMLRELAPNAHAFATLSGPGFAREVARGKPAAIVAACVDDVAARRMQDLFASPSMRVYRSSDVTGVEYCGAAKNVIAIAAGISDGLDLGSSARAAVVTRGLAELARLVEAAGGQRETAMGLAGLGDLVLTCTGDLSRNRSFGLKVGREGSVMLSDADEHGPIAEGVANARSIMMLAHRHGVEMPIVNAVYRTLYEAEPPKAMVDELLSRALKAEF